MHLNSFHLIVQIQTQIKRESIKSPVGNRKKIMAKFDL